MKKYFPRLLFAAPVLLHAETVEVKTAAEFRAAAQNLVAGDTLILADGSYDLGKIVVSAQGTAEKPVTIAARNLDQATITGTSSFVFERAAFVTLKDFNFETADTGPVVIAGSHHIRVTRCVLRVDESPRAPGALIRWILITGAAENGAQELSINSHHNRIDHNLLAGKRVRGQGVAIDGVTKPAFASTEYDRIDHNYFRDFGPRGPAMEAIRVSYGEYSLSSGHTVIEENLFENCAGDASQLIVMKNSDSVVRSNTVVNCQAGIYLRHGDRNEVYGIVVFGQNMPGSVGVRVWGNDHSIHDNYFQNLDAGIEVQNGDVDYPALIDPVRDQKLLLRHVQPQRIAITGNTLVDCWHPILLGGTEPHWNFDLPARSVRFENNFVLGGRNPLVTVLGDVPDVSWRDNEMWNGPQTCLGINASENQIRVVEPDLKTPCWLSGDDVGPLAGHD